METEDLKRYEADLIRLSVGKELRDVEFHFFRDFIVVNNKNISLWYNIKLIDLVINPREIES